MLHYNVIIYIYNIHEYDIYTAVVMTHNYFSSERKFCLAY